ncbi:cyclic nucleotide-binding domain-containing protein [bacterium]|nr:cyclic nucleotide-binding domain-containing protein [bacterium]
MAKAVWGLEKINLFKDLNPMELQEIMKIINKVCFQKGDVITDRDNQTREVYVLVEGSVDIVSLKGIPLYRVSKGEAFGELAMINTIKRTALAVAREESWIVVLNINHLERLGEEHPEVYNKISKNLVYSLGIKLARANMLIELLKAELTKALRK